MITELKLIQVKRLKIIKLVMSFLLNPHLDLTQSKIETERCIIVPLSIAGWVDVRELHEEFCRVNKDLYVTPFLPTYEEEIAWLTEVEKHIMNRELFENFIIEKETLRLVGCIWLNRPEETQMNIWLWIREDQQGKWYGTEAYEAMLEWAREHTIYDHLKHSLNPENTWSRKLAEKFSGVLQDARSENGDDWYKIYLR